MASDGRFVVVWDCLDREGVYGQRYDASGAAAGTEFRINTATSGNQGRPSVAMASDGRFVVVWQSAGQDGDGLGVYGQRYDASGASAGTEFRINVFTSADQRFPDVAMAPDGRFVVAWDSSGQDGDSTGVFALRYTADGSPIGVLPWP